MGVLSSIIIGLCVLAAFYVINGFCNRKFNEPPLVYYKYPIIGHTWDYINNMDEFLYKCRQEYGEIFSIYVYGSVMTVVCKEFSHEVFKSKDLSLSAAFEEQLPIARILELSPNYLEFATEIAREVFVEQMHLFMDKVQQSLHDNIDELIGECDEPKFIQNPRQLLLKIIAKASTIILIGDKLCHDKELVDIFMNFSDQLLKVFRIPEYLGFIHPWVFQQSLIMRFRYGGNHIKRLRNIIIEKIKPIVEERLEQERKYGDAWEPPVDCIQFMISRPGVDKKNIDYARISSFLLFVTFASMITTVSNFTGLLLNYSSRPEYWNYLLEEQEKINPNNDKIISLDQVSKMERLDSFLKESFRLTGHLLHVMHKVIASELKFSNGLQVPNGRRVGIYYKSIHHDKENYGPNFSEFDGRRYLGKDSPASRVSRDFIQFGMGRHACPGRDFAVNEIKIFVSILIKKYKITTKSGKRPPNIISSAGIAFPNPEPLIFEKRVKV